MRSDVRIVHNKLLGGWFIVRGSHDTPISGRFDSKEHAQAHLSQRGVYWSRGSASPLKQGIAKPVKTLRQACIERGIDPDNTGYRGTRQRLLNIDRIIPGVADRQSPSMDPCYTNRPNAHPRKMYTRNSAANDAAMIAEGGMVAYIAAFCRLNNLTTGA